MDAVVVGDERVSHEELGRRVATIRAALSGRTGPVAGYFEHSAFGVAAFLAVLTSRCWYVPLAPVQGAERVAAILRDCGAALVLTDLAVSFDGVEVVRVDRLAPTPSEPVAAQGIAYAIYTSGSTGTPKGVLIGHEALATSTAARVALYGPGGSLFLAAPFCFDSAVSMLAPLTTGGTVILSPPGTEQDALALARHAAHAGQVLLLPSVYGELLEVWGQEQPASLAVATVAGEALPASLVRRHFDLAPDRRLVNEYGPTEATVFCLAHECTSSDVDPVPIGRPVRGYDVRLADGEIWVSGALSDGYLGNPTLTAEKFVQWGSRRWYRTGDLGRARPDGGVEFLGRIDDQVKVRGVRVELSEVDALLASLPGVSAAAAAVAGERLVGFVCGRAAQPVELRSRGVAEFLVPQAIYALESLPRTASGKIDRRALSALVPGAPSAVAAREGRSEPLDGLGALRAACADVLGAAPLADATFLDLGDSLAAMRVGVRLHRMGWRLDPTELLGPASLRAVAARLTPATHQSTVDSEPGALSPQQMGIWFTESLVRGSNAFTVPLRLRFDGLVDADRLGAALRAVVERHPVLGCRVAIVERRPVLVPCGEPPALEVLAAGLAEFDALAEFEASEPIDLRSEPPLRAVLLMAPERCELLLTLHHIAFDGWSKSVLIRDLAAAYNAELPSAGPAGGHPMEAADASEASEAARQLEGFPPILSLRDPSTQDSPRLALASTIVDLEPGLRKDLEDLAARRGCTVFTVLLAGFADGLFHAAGAPSMIVGTATANRPTPELEDSVGMFTNIVPVGLNPGGATDLLEHTRERLLAALRFAHVPLPRVVEAVAPPRDPRYAPLVQVLFEYFGVPAPVAAFGGIQATLDDSGPQQGAVCDFSLRVFPRGDGLRCVAVHDASVVPAATAARVLAAVRAAWHHLVLTGGR